MMWSTHSRRIDPISRSAKPFCQGEAGAVGLSFSSAGGGRGTWIERLPVTRHLPGNTMPANKPTARKRGQLAKVGPPPAYTSSTLSMVTQNLINMVIVSAVSGAVLLGLLAARHF
jgi:hypothetical protein